MGAKAIWHGFKNAVFGRYDDDKFWRRRHALLTGSARGIHKIYYSLYVDHEMRRSCADIMPGWNDETSCVCENFLAPPNITAHGINGIVIAGGGDYRAKCDHLSPGNYRTKQRESPSYR